MFKNDLGSSQVLHNKKQKKNELEIAFLSNVILNKNNTTYSTLNV